MVAHYLELWKQNEQKLNPALQLSFIINILSAVLIILFSVVPVNIEIFVAMSEIAALENKKLNFE